MSFNSMKNGPTREELQRELSLAQSANDREKASSLVKQLREMDDPTKANDRKKLEKDLSDAQLAGKRDDAEKIINQLKSMDTPTKANEDLNEFDESLKKIQEKLKNPKINKKDLQKEINDFLIKDLKKHRDNIGSNIQEIQNSKQAEIDRLRNQLSGAMSEDFSLREYFSPERIRLAKLKDSFRTLKNDTAKYPKNVLIYAMSYSKGLLGGAKQPIKRQFFKMALRWNSNKIGEKIQNLEKELQPTGSESEKRKFTKQLILEQVKEAKIHYLNNVKQDIGLAA